jgi:predicted ATPase
MNLRRTNVIEPPDRLVGRTEVIDAALRAVDDGARIITITGPAGIGKSRVARHLVLAMAARDPELWAWRLDVSSCADVAALRDAVGGALGVPAGPQRDESTIEHALSARGRLVLWLDDLDLLAAPAASAVAAWAYASPESCWIVASRQRLGIAEELVFELPPLSTRREGPGGEAPLSTALLVELASRRGVVVAASDLPVLDALGEELDGNPLALQLAAARLSVMAPRVLLHRLRANRTVLQPGGASRSQRSSLDAAIEGSWNALLPCERETLSQCTVFRGSFDLDAAEAVVDLSGHPDAGSVADIIQGLRDKSMLRGLGGAGGDQQARLALYRSIGAYAAERLAPDQVAALRQRHAEYYVAVCESAAARWQHGKILVEADNLLAVVENVLGRGPVTARNAEPALRAVLLLAPGLMTSGPLRTLLRSLDPVIDVTRDSGANPLLVARVLALRGSLRRASTGAAATRDLLRALGMARALADKLLEATCLLELGRSLFETHDLANAALHFEQSLSLHRAAGCVPGEAACWMAMGNLEARRDQPGQAQTLLERAVALYRTVGDTAAGVPAMRALGWLHLDQGDHAGASRWLTEASTAAEASSDRVEWAQSRLALGAVALDEGRPDAAIGETAAALGVLREQGETAGEAEALGQLGLAHALAGRAAEAYALLRSAVVVRQGAEDASTGFFQAVVAHLDRAAGRETDAAHALDAAARIASSAGERWLDQAIAVVRDGRRPGPEQAGSVRVRLAVRLIEQGGLGTPAPPLPDDALVVAPKAVWLRLPDGRTIDLERRRPLARIMARLAIERCQKTPHALGWEALLAAGWPGEKVLPSAGAHRVRVAISTLRKLGVGDVIKTVEDGYVIDDRTPVVVLDRQVDR